MLSGDKVLADGEGRVAGETDVSITEGQFGQEFHYIVPIFGVLVSEKLTVAYDQVD